MKAMDVKAGMLVKLSSEQTEPEAEFGIVDSPAATRFVGKVPSGTVGKVAGRHPNKKLRLWWLVEVDGGYAPVHANHMEPA